MTVDYRVTIDGAAVDGKVTLEVKPRAITVAAQDASKTYGEDDPKFTYDVTSGELVEGESLQGIEIERDDDDSVRDGGYALRLTQPEGANSNYKITFKDGTFTIGKRELAVTWDTTTGFTYDGEKHCPQAKLHNVIEGDDVSAYVDGAKVKAGTPLLKVDLEAIRAAGHPTATALIVTNSDDLPEISVVANGDAAAGTPVFKFKK